MVANPKFNAALAHVDDAAIQPLPRSRKAYVEGSRPDLRVPVRQVHLTNGQSVTLYDTSGPIGTGLSTAIANFNFSPNGSG